MECYKCGAKLSEGYSLIPVDPRGTKDRRYACLDCATEEQKSEVPQDVKDICGVFDPKFKQIRGEYK